MKKFTNKEEFDNWVEEESLQREKDRKEKHDRLWDNLPHLDTPEKVPDLPVVESEDAWKNFYVPRLISAGAIPKKDLKDGHFYLGEHRRGRIGKWVESENRFHYWRVKFNQCFIDKCEHFEDHSQFSVFVPVKEVGEEEWDKTNLNYDKEC